MTEREYSQLIILVKNRKIFLEIIVTFLEVFRKLCQKGLDKVLKRPHPNPVLQGEGMTECVKSTNYHALLHKLW